MKALNILVMTLLSTVVWSQVPKKIVVEHFTNSVCSVCATRNPGFYTNLANQSDVIHLAIHPSSPYSSCLLNQHNTTENDARTNYYGIYGATPRLVIQGEVISPNANYSAAALFTPYIGQTTPIQLNVYQQKFNDDSIRVQVVIQTVSAHSLSAASLVVVLAEDTLGYAAPNGENQHYDVFRKSLTPIIGSNVMVPSTIGDSIVYTYTTPINGIWDVQRLFAVALLQETANKNVIQSGATLPTDQSTISGITENENSPTLFDVVVTNGLQNQIQLSAQTNRMNIPIVFQLFDVTGKMILQETIGINNHIINVSAISSGIYFYAIQINNEPAQSGKLFIQ